MPTPKRSISSRVTIQNPRPRKYASAAERQKALRERFPTLCVRVEQEQADFMKRIADEQGRTLQDVHLAFIKYANGRGNQWLTQGLKGFAPLPRFEETPKDNPMKRKPTPAQIAARERFAEMARSGAFKRKNNPMVISKQADESLSRKGSRGYVRELLDRYSDDGHVVSVKKTRSGSIGIAFDGGRLLTVESARKKLEDHYGITERMKRRSNPSRSGIGFEGYDPYASIDRLDEYRQKSDAELRYIIQDAGEAARAQRGMSSEAKYLDQVNDATTVLYERRLAREKAIAASNRSGRKIGKREASSINRLLTGRSNPRASNPQARSVKHTGARNIAYAVQAKRMLAGGGAQFETVAGFPTKAQAQDYIDALLKSYPKGLTLRISAA